MELDLTLPYRIQRLDRRMFPHPFLVSNFLLRQAVQSYLLPRDGKRHPYDVPPGRRDPLRVWGGVLNRLSALLTPFEVLGTIEPNRPVDAPVMTWGDPEKIAQQIVAPLNASEEEFALLLAAVRSWRCDPNLAGWREVLLRHLESLETGGTRTAPFLAAEEDAASRGRPAAELGGLPPRGPRIFDESTELNAGAETGEERP